MAEESCKVDHATIDESFCPKCGKQLDPDPEITPALERVVRRVLKQHGIELKTAKEEPAPSTLHDKFFGKGKKKEEKK